MPQCGCFHSYELTPVSSTEYKLNLPSGGLGNLKDILERSRLVTSISDEISTRSGFFVNFSGRTFVLQGVREINTLSIFLDILKNKLIVDLTPELDECYALGPYSVFEEDIRFNSSWGEMVNRAKYWRDPSVLAQLLARIEDFIEQHIPIRTVNAIVSAPKSDNNTPDLAGMWAQEIANKRGLQRLIARKTNTNIGPQKNLDGTETEDDLISRVANSVSVTQAIPGSRVLILDDTIRSGGTLKEIARALRVTGAIEVYGISAAKDAKFTQGGVDLNKEMWE